MVLMLKLLSRRDVEPPGPCSVGTCATWCQLVCPSMSDSGVGQPLTCIKTDYISSPDNQPEYAADGRAIDKATLRLVCSRKGDTIQDSGLRKVRW
jgi:hypothetical protein